MKTILVVCPTERDKREIVKADIPSQCRVLFYEYDDQALEKIICNRVGWLSYDFKPEHMLENIIAYAQQHAVDGIVYSEDYPGSILATIVAKKLGLVGPDPSVVIGHQHKYYSRLWQQQYVPEATPPFWLVDPHDMSSIDSIPMPVFLKPIKSFFSVFANEIHQRDELLSLMKHAQFPEGFLEQFNWFLTYGAFDLSANYLIAEELLRGEQCTIEGFVHQGEVELLGVTDSIMFPGTISFKRFEYPSCLPQSVQERMASIATTLMKQTGFDNGFFNIEFMYNPDTDQTAIIEVNPRAVSQFADLYEKVDGINSYQHLVQLALGEKPTLVKGRGAHALAGSCVLRIFENKRVRKAPGPKELEQLYAEFPDARCQIYVRERELLSDAFQDGKSYRYGLVHLGARDSQELQEKFERCREILGFRFEPI